jgi:hypothetical protein
MSRLRIIDNVLQVVITINSIFLILFGIPALLVQRDLLRMLRRFCLLTGCGVAPNFESQRILLEDGSGCISIGSQGIHLRTHARGISKTAGPSWPSELGSSSCIVFLCTLACCPVM